MSDEAPGPTAAGGAPAGSDLADEEIVRRVMTGEHALFEVLMRRYNQRLYRVARSILRDEAEAEDVMQQAYVNAYVHLDQFADRARFSTWLTRIAVHEALARFRRRGRARQVDLSSDSNGHAALRSEGLDPEQALRASELRRVLERSLDALPRSARTLFIMREVEGLTTAETAECLGVSEDVVKTRLHRARLRLRKDLLERVGLARQDLFTFLVPRCDRMVSRVFASLPIGRHIPAAH